MQTPAWRVLVHDNLASTQDVAMEAARAGDPGWLAVLAHRQTAGRGTRGRCWVSPPGNLNLSALIRPGGGRPDPGRWSLMAGVALHDALSPHAQGLMLKWPNDVLLHGAKLAGVLIDSGLDADGGLDWVVVGMGANLATAPSVQNRTVACLGAAAPPPCVVARAALDHLAVLDRLPTAAIVQAWLARAHPLGTVLEVRTPLRSIVGAFEGLAPDGALLVDGKPVRSAEVFL